MPYPEDIKERKELRQYQEIFENYSPIRKPIPEEEYEDVHEDDVYDDIDPKELEYEEDYPELFLGKPIKVEDSKRFAPK